MFKWYHVGTDGTATVCDDTGEIRKRIDSGEPGWFGSPEGAILHGGVKATAFKRKTEMTYSGDEWVKTGAMVPVGEITITTITAEPRP